MGERTQSEAEYRKGLLEAAAHLNDHPDERELRPAAVNPSLEQMAERVAQRLMRHFVGPKLVQHVLSALSPDDWAEGAVGSGALAETHWVESEDTLSAEPASSGYPCKPGYWHPLYRRAERGDGAGG